MTKYGVEAFSDALRREMQPWGIKVIMLEPGSFLTNICAPNVFEQQLRQAWNMLSDELKNEYGEEYLNAGINLIWGTKKKLLAADLNLADVVTVHLPPRKNGRKGTFPPSCFSSREKDRQ